jgi:hypothetical protein
VTATANITAEAGIIARVSVIVVVTGSRARGNEMSWIRPLYFVIDFAPEIVHFWVNVETKMPTVRKPMKSSNPRLTSSTMPRSGRTHRS